MEISRDRTGEKREWFLSYIARWQFMTFLLLLVLVWVIELMDLPALYFHSRPASLDAFRASLLSSAVIICAIIAVGNTYLQQKHILRGHLVICRACGRVETTTSTWESMERYIEEKTLAKLSHGVCPDCLKTMEREISVANKEAWKPQASDSNS